MKSKRSVLGFLLLLFMVSGSACRLEEDEAPPSAPITAATAETAPSPEEAQPNLRAIRVIPDSTKSGVAFNVQKNGMAAISLITENATRHSVIVASGQELETTYGSPSLLTAYVPGRLYASPGELDIVFLDRSRSSNPITFAITP